MHLTEREMYIIAMCLENAIEELKADPSPHEEDQMTSNKYYLEVKALKEKFPSFQEES
jgi:hypothetical protein